MADEPPPTRQQPAVPPSRPQYCRTCQAELAEGAQFCSACGRPQTTTSAGVDQTQVLAPAPVISEERIVEERALRPVAARVPSSWLTPGLVMGALGLAVLILAVVLLASSDDGGPSATTTTTLVAGVVPSLPPLTTPATLVPPTTTPVTTAATRPPTTVAEATTTSLLVTSTTAATVPTTVPTTVVVQTSPPNT